jgi:hypothetical protein
MTVIGRACLAERFFWNLVVKYSISSREPGKPVKVKADVLSVAWGQLSRPSPSKRKANAQPVNLAVNCVVKASVQRDQAPHCGPLKPFPHRMHPIHELFDGGAIT